MVEVCGGKDKNPSREDMKNRILKIISCLAVSAALLLCLGTAEIFAQTANETQVQAAPAEQAKAKQTKGDRPDKVEHSKEIEEPKYDADAALSEADKRIKARRAELDREAVAKARNMHFMLKSLIGRIEKNHPDLAASLKTQYLGIRLVQYLASLTILLFTFILTKYGLNFILKKLLYVSTKIMGESSFMSILAKQIKKPLNILAIIVGLYFAFVFLLRDSGNIVTLARGAGIVFWIAVFWCIGILSDTFFMTATKRLRKSSASTANLFEFIRRVSKAVIYTIAVLSILTNCGVNVNTIIASLGIGGMALAFASQDTIANFFGSVSIIVDRPFIVGDYVKTSACEGTVETIGFRSTRIRTPAKTLVTIPNSGLAKEPVENLSKMEERRVVQIIGLTYDSKPDQIRDILGDLRSKIQKVEGVSKDMGVLAEFCEFADSSLNIEIIYYTEAVERPWHMATRTLVNMEIMKLVEGRGLSFAYPSMSLYVEKAPENKK